MNYYEFIMIDKSGCIWEFEENENNVIIKANSEKEATEILLSLVSDEYEEEAKRYNARKIVNMRLYSETHYYTIWE